MHKWLHVVCAHVVFALCALCGLALFPVLVVSHRCQEAFFAVAYRLCQWTWHQSIAPVRCALLARLDHVESNDSSLKSRGAVRVLEVGAAYGANLQFVRRPIEYWRVEPNTAFDSTFRNKLAANPKVKMERSFCGFGEDMHMLPDTHFDAVLLTYVLCSAKDGRKLLSECRRVLRKGGLLLFLEHVAHPTGSMARSLQDVFAAFARNMTCGCHINRESDELIKSAGFAKLEMEKAILDIPCLYNCNIAGVAVA